MIYRICLTLFLPLILSGVAYGQTWGGCVAAGVPVPTILDPSRSGIAFGGDGKIVIVPRAMRSLPPSYQKFIYWHECGHVVFGHTGPSPSNEMDADCFAFRILKSTHNISATEIVQIGREISRTPGDGTHLSGPERADRLLDCSSDHDMAYKDNMKSNKPAPAKTKRSTKAEKATSNQSTKNDDN